MQPDSLISLISVKGLRMPFIPGGGRPEWTAQEAAMACRGLPLHVYYALVYTYAGDYRVHAELADHLWGFGHSWRETDRRRSWPELVNGEGYMRILADMLLLEIRQPWRFVRQANSPTPDLRRMIVGCGKDEWRRDVSPIYEAMVQEFTIWISIGLGRIRRSIQAG